VCFCFVFSSRRRHTRLVSDWSSDVCSSDLITRPEKAELPTTLPADLLGRRPDVVAQRWRVESATRGVAAAAAAFYPNINLAGFEIGRASCRERVWVAGGVGVLNKRR